MKRRGKADRQELAVGPGDWPPRILPQPAPPPSRIWASAQSLPAAARGTCPRSGRKQTLPLRLGAPSRLSARRSFSPRGGENTIHETCSFPASKSTLS